MTKVQTPIPHYLEMAKAWNPKSPGLVGDMLCLDPGETTGWAHFRNGHLHDCGQWITKDLVEAGKILHHYLSEMQGSPKQLVVEDYKVYSWKSDEHKWAALHTPKWIGAITVLAGMFHPEARLTFQMAVQAKQFCTDDKLEAWNLYKPGLRHGRDAIRHGVSFILFDKSHLA